MGSPSDEVGVEVLTLSSISTAMCFGAVRATTVTLGSSQHMGSDSHLPFPDQDSIPHFKFQLVFPPAPEPGH